MKFLKNMHYPELLTPKVIKLCVSFCSSGVSGKISVSIRKYVVPGQSKPLQ